MALQPANHYVISGKGIEAVIDTAGITGAPAVSLTVAGRSISDRPSAPPRRAWSSRPSSTRCPTATASKSGSPSRN